MLTTTTLTDEEQVAALRAKGVGERCIARWMASTTTTRPVAATKARTPTSSRIARETRPSIACTTGTGHRTVRSEASIQAEIVKALKAAGWRVWRIGQRDARKTQDPGVPDLYAVRPAVREVAGQVVWVECKRADGRQSQAQRGFQRLCDAVGERYIVARGVDDIRELL